MEDIYSIMQLSKKAPKTKIMAQYYEKLINIFWVSGNYLFHAYAWYKYYTLNSEFNFSMTASQKVQQASCVLLATLSIPTLQTKDDMVSDEFHDANDPSVLRTTRLAALMGFSTNTTRESLLTELKANNILSLVPKEVRELYEVLEETSNPLKLISSAKPLIEGLEGSSATEATEATEAHDGVPLDTNRERYIPSIKNILILKFLKQLGTVYDTISISAVDRLTREVGIPFHQIEGIICAAVKSKMVDIRIDHMSSCLRFGEEDDSELVRNQLCGLSGGLRGALQAVVNPQESSPTRVDRAAFFREIKDNLDAEHASILSRKNEIEKRKEEFERVQQEIAREEERKKLEEERRRKEEEDARLRKESELREREKLRKIELDMEMAKKKTIIKNMGKDVENMDMAELEKLDADALAREAEEKKNKEADNKARRSKEIAKKLDYVTRAVRIEEVPAIRSTWESDVELDRRRHEEKQSQAARQAREKWESEKVLVADLREFGVFQRMDQWEADNAEARLEQRTQEAEAARERQVRKLREEKLARARKRRAEEEARAAKEERAAREEEERIRREEEERLLKEEQDRGKAGTSEGGWRSGGGNGNGNGNGGSGSGSGMGMGMGGGYGGMLPPGGGGGGGWNWNWNWNWYWYWYCTL